MSTILITGAGRGIGRASALRLAASGWQVYAGVRRDEDGAALVAEATRGAIVPVQLDVTDDALVAALPQSLPQRLDAVLNNAGIVVDGPVEALELEDLRRQFEVNVVGQLAVTQKVLPAIRASRGRIVFVSSLSGEISTPWTGAYNASKFALEALADALRVELRPWGIRVVLVQPSSTDTDLWRLALQQLDATESALGDDHRRLYAGHVAGMRRATKVIQKQAVPVERVVATIERALGDPRPKARYPVGAASRLQLALGTALPTWLMDASLARLMGIPRKA